MTMKEYQIIVERTADRCVWYTAQWRKVHFLWRGRWNCITPIGQTSLEDAEAQIRKHYIDNL